MPFGKAQCFGAISGFTVMIEDSNRRLAQQLQLRIGSLFRLFEINRIGQVLEWMGNVGDILERAAIIEPERGWTRGVAVGHLAINNQSRSTHIKQPGWIVEKAAEVTGR